MKRHILLAVAALISVLPLRASSPGDSSLAVTAGKDSLLLHKENQYRFRATQIIAPVTLTASAFAFHYACRDASGNVIPESVDGRIRHYFYNEVRQDGAKGELSFDNYLQYAPYVLDLGLGMLGAKARNTLVDRTIELAIGSAACVVMSWSLKNIFNSTRPNGGGLSFPSGHTCTVFLGAELVRIEYGYGWGAAAYAMGVTVGTMRMYNDWHWFSDVLLGAGIGILAANIGGWLLEPVKSLFHIPDVKWDGLGTRRSCELSILPTIEPASNTYMASIALSF